MLRTGLVSVTFRKLAPREIIALAGQAGLDGIEWGGDVHVPHRQITLAAEVHRMTRDAGLTIAAYGSYYRVGVSEANGLPFASVLETAVTLSAPTVRVWAGNRGSADADDRYRAMVNDDARRIADLAQAAGLTVSFEYHGQTLTDTQQSAVRLLMDISHPNVRAYWQPPLGMPNGECIAGLQELIQHLTNVHVFHWLAGLHGADRRPLQEGKTEWLGYLDVLRAVGGEHYALLEFVRDDMPQQMLADAGTLRGWLRR